MGAQKAQSIQCRISLRYDRILVQWWCNSADDERHLQ